MKPLPLRPFLGIALLSAAITYPASAGEPLVISKQVILPPAPRPHGFFVRGFGNAEWPVSGDAYGSFRGTVNETDVHWAGGGDLDVDIDGKDISDVYDTPLYGGGMDFGWQLNPNWQWYVGAGYLASSTGGWASLGTIGGFDASADFDKYQAWRLYTGVRYDLMPNHRLSPYIGAFVGVSFASSIDATISVPDAGYSQRVPFYDDSETIFTGATIGLAYDITRNFEIGVETGFTYQGGLDADDTFLGPAGLNINNGGSFYTIPVKLFGTFYF